METMEAKVFIPTAKSVKREILSSHIFIGIFVAIALLAFVFDWGEFVLLTSTIMASIDLAVARILKYVPTYEKEEINEEVN